MHRIEHLKRFQCVERTIEGGILIGRERNTVANHLQHTSVADVAEGFQSTCNYNTMIAKHLIILLQRWQ